MTDEMLPDKLRDVLRWAPTYHVRKNAILYNYHKSTEHYLICGKLLCDSDRGNDWKHDGSCARNFYHWVENELHIKRTQAQRMMGIWKAFKEIIDEQMDLILQVDFSKLALIAPFIPKLSQEEQIEMIYMAKENTFRDLDNNLKEISGGISQDVCEHNGAFEIYHKCTVCGKFQRA